MNTKDIIAYEKKLYFSSTKEYIKELILSSNKYKIWSFVKCMRREEQMHVLAKRNKLFLISLAFYRRKKNILGRQLGFDIPGGVFGPGLLIHHPSSISVNPNAKVGNNAVIVGNLCIGNKGGKKQAPQIGDACVFGWDTTIIGDIKVGCRCKIGAKALVNHSFEENDAVLVGIPAKNIAHKKGKEYENTVHN